MANESASSTPAAASTASSESTAGVETQSINTQADTTQSSDSSNTELSSDVEIEAKPAPTEAEIATLSASEKLNVNEMIVKQLRGEEFTEADKAKLEKAGLSVEQISTLAEAHKQVQLKNNNEIYEAVGGQEVYEGLKTFASEHLDDSEADAINQALRSGNMKIAKLAVLGLKAMSEQMNGRPASKRIDGSGSSSSTEGAYADQQELIKDLNNRKYGKDPEFTARVDARRNKSGF
jgi:hypothetical protein